jgi:hypothetical protein
MEELKYVIFNCSELFKINFNEVKETSNSTLRRSIDETKTFVKFVGETPQSINNLETKTELFTHSEIIDILSTSEWTKPIGEYDAFKY